MLSEMRFHILQRGAPPWPPSKVQWLPWASDMHSSALSHPHSANQRPPEASQAAGPHSTLPPQHLTSKTSEFTRRMPCATSQTVPSSRDE